MQVTSTNQSQVTFSKVPIFFLWFELSYFGLRGGNIFWSIYRLIVHGIILRSQIIEMEDVVGV